jgi:hypothetical protein
MVRKDTTRHERKHVSNMKERGGERENNTAINTIGRGKGCVYMRAKPSYKTGRSWYARGSIQGWQETQRDVNASA